MLYGPLSAICATAQGPHFSAPEEMNIWYNPALKTNKHPQAQLHFKTVSYPGILTYTNKAASIDLPMISREAITTDNIFFANLSAGIQTESSADRFMNASTAMLAFSYALPLNDNNTYLAIGFQGNYSFNRFGDGGSEHFPEGFDKYGAFASSMTNDPSQSGYSFGYFTAGAGAAVFHDSDQWQWYLGASIRHFNKPYTEWNRSERLAATTGIQGGYTMPVSSSSIISGYINISWQQNSPEQLFGLRYIHSLEDTTINTLFAGIGYRAGDALVPNLGLEWRGNRIAFYYEINTSPYEANKGRRSWSVAYRLYL